MGKIIRFPIRILTDKANETQHGLTPRLRDSVRPIETATTEDVVSEAGIYRSLTGDVEMITSGENLGNGLPIFNDVSGDAVISYNSLSGMGVLNTTSDGQSVFINTTQPGIPGDGSITTINTRTLNGGINQEASKVGFDDFSDGSFVAFHNVQNGDAIGKILIKATEPFDDGTTKLSIGTISNEEYFVKKFDAPSSVTTDKLIPIEYGVGMYDKITYGSEIQGGGENPPVPSVGRYTEYNEDISVSTTNEWTTVTTTNPELKNCVAEILLINGIANTNHLGVRSMNNTTLSRYIPVPGYGSVGGTVTYRTYVNIDANGQFQIHHTYSGIVGKIVGAWTNVVYTEVIRNENINTNGTWGIGGLGTSNVIMDCTRLSVDHKCIWGIRQTGSLYQRYIELGKHTAISLLVNTDTHGQMEYINTNDSGHDFMYTLGYFSPTNLLFKEKWGRIDEAVPKNTSTYPVTENYQMFTEKTALVTTLAKDICCMGHRRNTKAYFGENIIDGRGAMLASKDNTSTERIGVIMSTEGTTSNVSFKLNSDTLGTNAVNNYRLYITGYFK